MERLELMKKSLAAILFSTLLVLGTAAHAADQNDSGDASEEDTSATEAESQDSDQQADSEQAADSDAEDDASAEQDTFIERQESSQVLASSIMGVTLQNGTGDDAEDIGTVNDLILNDEGELEGVVVGVGGFLGIGEKSVGIAWTEVGDIDPETGTAAVDVSAEELENAPAFETQQEQKQKQQQQQQMQQQQQQQQQSGAAMD